ncbi:MAG: DNA repair exonuclease [Aquificae bacterium]|nr:DNA repair exonuclease [Aquificota bacterium]
MKFLHVTDTHLGYRQYGLEERARDFFDVFDEAIDLAIQHKVDFVLHSGDFFHTSRPSNSVILEGLQLLSKLKSANIPIFLIPGNHDRGNKVKDVSPLHILRDFGANLIEQGTVEYEGIYISGVKYLSKIALKKIGTIKPVLERFLENSKNRGIHLLMLHQEFTPHFPHGLYLSKEIPKGFSYVGIGHLHERVMPFYNQNCMVVYPGSTEFTAFSKNEEQTPKGVFLVEKKENSLEANFIELKRRRPFLSFEFEEESFLDTVKDIKTKLESIREYSDKSPVVILKGYIEKLSIKDLNAVLAKNGIYLDKNNVLHINFLLKTREDSKKQKDIFSLHTKQIDIEKELKRLIGDELLVNHVYEIISQAKSMESIEDFKEFLKENYTKLDI